MNWIINYNKTIDFNYPVFTSISWNKSDRYIKRKYKKNVTINTDCSIDTKLEIVQSHYFTKDEEVKVNDLLTKYNVENKDHILNIQWRWENKQFLRVFLPKNAIVQIEPWMEIKEFDNYLSVELFTNTRRLETINNTIEYTIENKDCREYNYKLYKQPWIRSYDIESDINWENFKFEWVEEDYYYLK